MDPWFPISNGAGHRLMEKGELFITEETKKNLLCPKFLTQAELSGGRIAAPTNLTKAKKVESLYAYKVMTRMGWKEGDKLGKNKNGRLEPVIVDVTKPVLGYKKGPEVELSDLNGKHPTSFLFEICKRNNWESPTFALVSESGPRHKKQFIYKVICNGVEYLSGNSAESSKVAKSKASLSCLENLQFVTAPQRLDTKDLRRKHCRYTLSYFLYSHTVGSTGSDKKNYSERLALQSWINYCGPTQTTFILINFNVYGQLHKHLYIPSEVALTAFNIECGIIDNLCSVIDPYCIPNCMEIIASSAAKDIGIPYPPFDNNYQDYGEILRGIERFLDKHTLSNGDQPKVFCLTGDKQKINGCLNWLFLQLGKTNKFELFSFGEAMCILSQIGVTNRCRKEHKNSLELEKKLIEEQKSKFADQISSSDTCWESERIQAGLFYHEHEVTKFLSASELLMVKEISCIYHYHNIHGSKLCALNKTNRYAYKILDVMTRIFDLKQRKLSGHTPDIWEDPLKEFKCREMMLKEWEIGIITNQCLQFDSKVKPKHLIIDIAVDPLDPR